jgi:hypothetical protein
MKARGAVEITNDTAGFSAWDAEGDDPRYHDPAYLREIAELELRQHELKPPASHLEAAQQQYEEACASEKVRECRWLHQVEDGITEFTPGKLMHRNEFMRLLQILRPDAQFNDFAVIGRRGLNFFDPSIGRSFFATTVQDGVMIEWSQMRVDAHGVPTNERYRGWRAVLMVLIEKDIISEEECAKVFGQPTGPRANRWFRMLYMRRNHKCPECSEQLCACKNRYSGLRSDKYRSTESSVIQ